MKILFFWVCGGYIKLNEVGKKWGMRKRR
jgi:hypothetical protein